MAEKIVGCFWGRFNPPHKGHVGQVRRMLEQADFLYVMIGSGERRDERRNPFSGAERKRLMQAYLREEGIDADRVQIRVFGSKRSSAEKVEGLLKSCPEVNTIFISKRSRMYREAKAILGKRMRFVDIRRGGHVSARKLREAIAQGKEWRHLTGRSVADLIVRFNGIRRIRRAYGKEK